MRNAGLRRGVAAIAAVTGIVFAAMSCASGASSSARSGPSSRPSGTTSRGPERGVTLYRTQCAGCHGARGEGNLGPPLTAIADRMSEADQVALVETGRGRMPAFVPGLDGAQIAAVVAYTRTQLR